MCISINKYIAVLLFSAICLTSCMPTLTPFTERLQDENRWSDQELKRIQFYLSEDLVLTRQVNRGSSEIRKGEIKTINGKRVEEVVIRRKTPGVFLYSRKDDHFAVTFESNSDDHLMFGPNPKVGGRYVLLASNWNKKEGRVSYAGKKWRVGYRDAMTGLLVNLKKTRNISVKTRTASGRKID